MDEPTLRQLRYFLVVADELHFGRAAQRIGIAQPPLTQQIQKLEQRLGCALLARGRRTRLTEAGAALAGDARRLIAQAEQTFDAIRRLARGEAGEIRVGVPPSVMLTALPGAVRRYRQLYPDVRFTLRELATSAIEEALRIGEIDLGFLRESQPGAPLRCAMFLTEPVVAILPATHALAVSRTITPHALRKLRTEPFVMFPRRLGPALYDSLTGACAAAGFTPNVVQEATQWQTVVAFVAAGTGVSLAPESVRQFRTRGVAYRAIPWSTTSVYASWRDESLSAAAERFLAIATMKAGKRD